MKTEANVLLFKCGKANREYGVRIQTTPDNDWERTWAFEITPKIAKSEGFDKNKVKGNLYATDDYPGCPYCGADGFVQCSKCKKISCWDGEKNLTCAWCGAYMRNIVLTNSKFDVKGNKF